MKFFLYIALVFSSILSFGQDINFVKSYGNTGYDVAKDIKQALDTGYICTGSSSSFTPDNGEAFLLKVDSMGVFEWSYNYGGTGSESGEAVINTLDSAYAICGYTNSSGNGGFDFYLVKTNSVGVPVLEKTYGGSDWDRAFSFVQLPDSGFVLVGETYSYGQGNGDVYIVRTNSLGDTLWTRTYGGPENDYALDVILDGDSLVIVGGTESFGAGMSDGLILKYNIDGTFGWVQYAGKERNDYFTSIKENFAGDEYFLGGSRHYYFQQSGLLEDFWIYNMSEDGNTLLTDTTMLASSDGTEIAHDITVDLGENIFWAGESNSFGNSLVDGLSECFLGKLLNTYFWAFDYVNNFGQIGEDVLYGIDFCYDLGIVACGKMKYQSTGGYNIVIARIDKSNLDGPITVTTELTVSGITLDYEEFDKSEKLIMYPTIVEDIVNFSGFPDNSQIMVVNMNGQIVKPLVDLENEMFFEELESGIYMFVIYNDNERISGKFIKK
jgi:hypothetical protein